MKARPPRLFVLSAVALVLGACPASTAKPDHSPPGVANDLPSNFNDAIGGLPVASVAAADQDVPFTAIAPQGLGTPSGIFVTDPTKSDPQDRVVELDYQTSTYGQVVVEEAAPQVPPDQWSALIQQLLAENGSAILHGSYANPTIRGGTSALLLTSEDGSQSEIRWLETSSVEIIVRGPTLSQDQCVQIADGF